MAYRLLFPTAVDSKIRRLDPFRSRFAAAVAALALLLAPPASAAAEPAPVGAGPPVPPWQWELSDEPVTSHQGALAVAAGSDGRAAVGDERGVLLRDASGIWRRLALTGAVRDLAFAPDGSLWIASDEGLYRLAEQRLETPVPAAGDAARRVLRVAPGARSIAVATEDGVFWSRDGRRFARVEGSFGTLAGNAQDNADDGAEPPPEFTEAFGENGLPAPASTSPDDTDPLFGMGLALTEPADPAAPSVLWIAAERGLFRAALETRDGAARVRARSVRTPAELRRAIDVAAGPSGVFALGEGSLLEGDAYGEQWRVHRPELPPGATPTRLLVTPDGIWIASDRGLVEAPRPGASWTRADGSAGTMPIAALAHASGRVFAAGERGLLVGARATRRAASASDEHAIEDGPPPVEPPRRLGMATCDPPIAEVRRAVLTHLDLGGERTLRMWAGVNKRALLPVVTLDGSYTRDRVRNFTEDESFVSNSYHVLHDRDRDSRRERDVALRLVWDLRDFVYHDEQIDVSTEARRTIQLRDDVLDEVHQLYFDRRRLLATLEFERAASAEAFDDRLRAEELAAGLDAWTGGWFGPRAGTSPCPLEHR